MSDEDRFLKRKASGFPLPADPLGGVADRLHRRVRRRRVVAGGVGVILTVALVGGLTQSMRLERSTPGQSVVQPGRTVEANGLFIDIPPGDSVFTSAQAFSSYQMENGAFSPLGLPRCGWSRPGPNAPVPTSDYVRQFVLAALLDDNPALSASTRGLLVLRDDQLSLDELTQCEIKVRRWRRAGVLEQDAAVIGGFRATRLVFAPVSVGGSYLPAPNDREVLFLVDVGSSRWALDFTVFGKGNEPAMAVPDFDAIAATVRFAS
jgi:hypothetical protein